MELKEIVSPEKTALLVWDVQKMLVNSIYNTDTFLVNLKKVIESAREKGITIMYSKITLLSGKFESPVRKFLWQNRPSLLSSSPEGFDLVIEPNKDEIVIPKNTASIFIGTNFELMLRNAGITTILFTGIATEIGVESSARDASNRGFFPVIITDAVSSRNEDAHNRSLENLKNMMILLKSDELISLW